jgi:hypothetical protein
VLYRHTPRAPGASKAFATAVPLRFDHDHGSCSMPYLPLNAFVECRAGNIFYRFHQVQQEGPKFLLARGKSHATVSHHDSGHTATCGRRQKGIPRCLGVIMRVYINPARGDHLSCRIDFSTSCGHLQIRTNCYNCFP